MSTTAIAPEETRLDSPATSWISEARTALKEAPVNYFEHSAWQYWFDFLLAMTIAYTAASIYLMSPLGSLMQIIAFPIAVFWLYRLGSLVHEVAHLTSGELTSYKWTWNLLAGVMLLTPSPFFARHHRDHHTNRMYGTREDPEYIVNVFQPGNPLSLLGFAATIAIYPVLVFLRFLLVPFTYIHPAVREWVLVHASSLTMNYRYERRLTAQDRWEIAVVEWLCFLRAGLILTAPFLIVGVDFTRWGLLYGLAVGTLSLNMLRLLADHHFESRGTNLDLPDHIRDSCNLTEPDLMTWVLCPFSIRYHALHHLFPTLPYHNLQGAHEYLAGTLPDESPYHTLSAPSWGAVAWRTLFIPPARLGSAAAS